MNQTIKFAKNRAVKDPDRGEVGSPFKGAGVHYGATVPFGTLTRRRSLTPTFVNRGVCVVGTSSRAWRENVSAMLGKRGCGEYTGHRPHVDWETGTHVGWSVAGTLGYLELSADGTVTEHGLWRTDLRSPTGA